MAGFIVSRILRAVLTAWVVFTLVFFATRLSGDAIDFIMPEGADADSRREISSYLGLNDSLVRQYWIYLGAALRGDFGLSFYQRRPVTTMYAERVWPTLSLAGVALLLSLGVGVPVGIIGALNRDNALGRLMMSSVFMGYAVPHFILGILLILCFGFYLQWLPSAGNATPAHYILPGFTLGAALIAAMARFTRSAMLEVLEQDYLRTARAKGLSERVVVLKHALRNALVPVLTILGLQITALIAGSIVVESVFSWPGMGELLVRSVIDRDYPSLQFGVVAIALLVVGINLAVDLLYAVIDPRIRVH